MAQPTSKELMRDLFGFKELQRVPFLPWICRFAAQLEQVPIKTLFSDAGVLSRSVLTTQKLFGYDAIVNIFDPTLEAEACGCKVDWSSGAPQVISHPLREGATITGLDIPGIEKRGRLPAVFEATKRLNIIKGKEVPIVAYITGPLTLAGHLFGEDILSTLDQSREDASRIIAAAGNVSLKLCRSYCELGVAAIVIAEEMLGRISPYHYQAVAAPLKSIWNVARFYNVHSILLTKGCSEEHIEPALGLQPDGLSISGKFDYSRLRYAALKRNCCYSRSIESYLSPEAVTREGHSIKLPSWEKGKGFFLSTEWEIPPDTTISQMHEIMRLIRSNQAL